MVEIVVNITFSTTKAHGQNSNKDKFLGSNL